jgi:hypothetical protein
LRLEIDLDSRLAARIVDVGRGAAAYGQRLGGLRLIM